MGIEETPVDLQISKVFNYVAKYLQQKEHRPPFVSNYASHSITDFQHHVKSGAGSCVCKCGPGY